MTIYQSTPGPWKQGGRSVETFRSGLVKVTQDYLCKTETVTTDTPAVGSTMDSTGTPAIDGIYVYPEPQTTDNGNGFSTIRVTGYGRTRTGYIYEPKLEPGEAYVVELTDGVLTSTVTEIYTKTAFVCRYTLKGGETPNLNFTALRNQFKMYDSDGSLVNFNEQGASTELAQTFAFQESNYFGTFQEWVTVVNYTPTRTTKTTT